jgi:hypothetical protein
LKSGTTSAGCWFVTVNSTAVLGGMTVDAGSEKAPEKPAAVGSAIATGGAVWPGAAVGGGAITSLLVATNGEDVGIAGAAYTVGVAEGVGVAVGVPVGAGCVRFTDPPEHAAIESDARRTALTKSSRIR